MRACVCESDGDSDLPIKVVQERGWSYGTEGRKEERETGSGKERRERDEARKAIKHKINQRGEREKERGRPRGARNAHEKCTERVRS